MTRAFCAAALVVFIGTAGASAQSIVPEGSPDPDTLALMLAVGPALEATPEPTAAPTAEPDRYQPAARSGRGPPQTERWRGLVAGYAWDVGEALRVIGCESGGDPGAVNRSSGAAGLFQLYGWAGLARRLFGSGDVLDPVVNTGTAFWLWRDSGGTFGWHWASSRGCWA